MELAQIRRRRRMVRHYTGEPVPPRDARADRRATDEPDTGTEPWFASAAAHVLALGHGAADRRWSKRTSRETQRRRALDEVVRWNHW